MKGKQKAVEVDRRGFLKRAGLAVGGAGAAAVAVGGQAVAAPAESETEKRGYRETEHVRTYYKLAKF